MPLALWPSNFDFAGVSLRSRDKQRFFHQMAQLLRSGISLPVAVEKLVRTGSSAQRAAAKSLRKRLEKGETAAEAFSKLSSQLDPMERSCLAASARTGRLEFTLQRLGDYFGVLNRARAQILQHSAYPLFILHFGILTIGLPTLVGEGGWKAYLRETGTTLTYFYGVLLAVAILWPIIREVGAWSGMMDRVLRLVPMVGRIRRDLGVARFFGTYDMQLDAGVNVMDSLLSAAEASRLGLVRQAAKRALPELRAGGTVGPTLEDSGALPREAAGAMVIAEETGELHRTLPKLQEEFEESGLRRLQIATEWIPRLLSLAVMGYVGWRIISFYHNYLGDVVRQIDAI